MGLLDSGFGLTFRMAVKGLPDIRRTQAELQLLTARLREQRRLAAAAGKSTAAYDRELGRLASDASMAQAEIAVMNSQMQRFSGIARAAGRAALVVGGALAGLGAGGLKFIKGTINDAINFESALKDLQIRANISEEAVQGLAQEFRQLSTELPGTAIDMAKAGSIIVRTGTDIKDVSSVIRESIILGIADPALNAEKAAGMLSKTIRSLIVTLDGVDKKFQRVNSSVIATADTVSATASQILDVTQRAGQAGSRFGLTADQIIAFSAAASQAGGQMQSIGTALASIFDAIRDNGGVIATELGIPFQEFSTMSAVEQMVLFTKSVGALDRSGQLAKMNKLLKAVGASGRRSRKAMIALVNATERLKDGSRAASFEASIMGQALSKSADQFENATLSMERMTALGDTAAIQMDIFRSVMTNISTVMGQAFLPVFKAVNLMLIKVSAAFSALPVPVQQGIAILIALGSVASVVIGGLLVGFGLVGFAAAGMATSLQTAGINMSIFELRSRAIDLVTSRFVRLKIAIMGVNAPLKSLPIIAFGSALNKARTAFLAPFLASLVATGAQLKSVKDGLTLVVGFLRGVFAGSLAFLATPAGMFIALGMAVAFVATHFEALKSAASVLFDFLTTGFSEQVEGTEALMAGGFSGLIVAVARAGFLFREFIAGVKSGFSQIPNVIGPFSDLFKAAVDQIRIAFKPLLNLLEVIFPTMTAKGMSNSLSVFGFMGIMVGDLLGVMVEGFRVLALVAIPVIRFIAEALSLPLKIILGIVAAIRKVIEGFAALAGAIAGASSLEGVGFFGKLKAIGGALFGGDVGIQENKEAAPSPEQTTAGVVPKETTNSSRSDTGSGSGNVVVEAFNSFTAWFDGESIEGGVNNVKTRNESRNGVVPAPNTSGALGATG